MLATRYLDGRYPVWDLNELLYVYMLTRKFVDFQSFIYHHSSHFWHFDIFLCCFDTHELINRSLSHSGML